MSYSFCCLAPDRHAAFVESKAEPSVAGVRKNPDILLQIRNSQRRVLMASLTRSECITCRQVLPVGRGIPGPLGHKIRGE